MPDIFDSSKKSSVESDQLPADSGQPSGPVAPITQLPNDQLVHSPTPTPPNTEIPHMNMRFNNLKNQIKRQVQHYSEVMKHETPSDNPLDAFAPRPQSVTFDTQDQEEQIILLLRRHPITQLKWIGIAIFLAILPLFLSLFPIYDFLPGRFQFALSVLWYLLIIGYILESFLTWFFNVYIITDERIIDVDFLNLIYKNITSAKIDNIEDVTAQMAGAIQSVFNFGLVKIQTAGTNAEIEFEEVPQPNKVTRLLNELILEEEREKVEGRVN